MKNVKVQSAITNAYNTHYKTNNSVDFNDLGNQLKLLVAYDKNVDTSVYRALRSLPPAVSYDEEIKTVADQGRPALYAALAEEARISKKINLNNIIPKIGKMDAQEFQNMMREVFNTTLAVERETLHADPDVMNKEIAQLHQNKNIVMVEYINMPESEIIDTKADGVVVHVHNSADVMALQHIRAANPALRIVAYVGEGANLAVVEKIKDVKIISTVAISTNQQQNELLLQQVHENQAIMLTMEPEVTMQTVRELPELPDTDIFVLISQMQEMVQQERAINEKAGILAILDYFQFTHAQNPAEYQEKCAQELKRVFLTGDGAELLSAVRHSVRDGAVNPGFLEDNLRKLSSHGLIERHIIKLIQQNDIPGLTAYVQVISQRYLAKNELAKSLAEGGQNKALGLENKSHELLFGRILFETMILENEARFSAGHSETDDFESLVQSTKDSLNSSSGEGAEKILDAAILKLHAAYDMADPDTHAAAMAGLLELLPLGFPPVDTEKAGTESKQFNTHSMAAILKAA